MSLFTWQNEMSVGVQAIDNDHQRIVFQINRIYDAIITHGKHEILEDVFADLLDYTNTHFMLEEKHFELTDYPEIKKHKREHDALRRRMIKCHAKYQKKQDAVHLLDLMIFLTKWWQSHIQSTDMGLKSYLTTTATDKLAMAS